MRDLFRLWSLVGIAAKQLLSQPALTLAKVLGVACAAVLVMSVPVYVDAVYYRLLRQELTGPLIDQQRPPFSFIFHYIGAIADPLSYEEADRAERFFEEAAPDSLKVPQRFSVSWLKAGRFGLYPQDVSAYDNPLARIANVEIGYLQDVGDHIILLEGALPGEAGLNQPVEVLLSEAIALERGVQVGEVYIAYNSGLRESLEFPVRISGIWRATDPADSYWFREPGTFEDILLVPETTFRGCVTDYADGHISEAVWFLVMDGTQVQVSDVGPLIVRILRVQAGASSLVPKVVMTSPLEALQRYYYAAQALRRQLYILDIPLVALVLIFIVLVAAMAVQRSRREIATLRSRGATRWQMVGVSLLGAILLGLLAQMLALPASQSVGRMATGIQSFMSLGPPLAERVGISTSAVRAGFVVVAFSLIAQAVPTAGAARHTMVTYRSEQARTLRPPWWQRTGLDLILLVPAIYGTYLLRRQPPPTAQMVQNDPFQNPLLVLVPTISILAMTLVIVRVLPWFVNLFARLAQYTRSVSFLMAVRHLARTPGFYAGPMVLLITTLSLAVFFSATAATLDQHLSDQMWYQIGAGAVVHPALDYGEEDDSAVSTSSTSTEPRLPNWYSVPVEDYAAVPSVVQVARVAKYQAWLPQTPSLERGIVVALDRQSFADVAYWREDFATESLGTLMNQLAGVPNGVLMPRDVLTRYVLNPGDTVRLTVDTFGKQTELTLQVVGSFKRFPTWNPTYGPLFVMNLDHLHGRVGMELPVSVWAQPAADTDPEGLREDLGRINPFSSVSFPLRGGIADEATRPGRQGVLGILSIGFMATSLLAIAGFLLYTLFSLQRRGVELGTLRAMGISFWSLSRYLAWELVSLILLGLAGGIGLGVAVSYVWIPYFRVGSVTFAEILPMNVVFSVPALLGVCAAYLLLMVCVLVLSVLLARRVRLFEAVKMLEVV